MLKVVLTRGTESSASGPTGFLTITELDLDLMDRVRTGIAIRTLDRGYASDAFAGASWLLGGAKLLSYAVHAAATRTAKAHGDDDAVFVSSDDYLLEGPTSAVLVLRDGRLTSTPPGATGILDSITLRQIFAAATDAGVPARHELIPVPELFTRRRRLGGVLDPRGLSRDPAGRTSPFPSTRTGTAGSPTGVASAGWRSPAGKFDGRPSLLAHDPDEADGSAHWSRPAAGRTWPVAEPWTSWWSPLQVSRVAAERLLDDEWPLLH
ncbi:MAG: aminotransferase class IV [Micropruina sp.]